MTDWRKFDQEDKPNTTPAPEVLVWVWEAGFLGEPGPQIGYFDGHCWRMWWGTDDCDVTHWADLHYPSEEPA